MQRIMRLDPTAVYGHEVFARRRRPSRRGSGMCPDSSAEDLTRLRACLSAIQSHMHLARRPIHVDVSLMTLTTAPPARLHDLVDPVADAGRLVIELDARELTSLPAGLGERLGELRELGVMVAVEGFGVGGARPSTLKALEPEIIKLDPALVSRCSEGAEHRRRLTAAVAEARTITKIIIADGVRTDQDLTVLREAEVPLAQGPLWGEPDRLGRTGPSRS